MELEAPALVESTVELLEVVEVEDQLQLEVKVVL
jgi:hypothetical protein